MGVIYLDSCVAVYALEDAGAFGSLTRAMFAEHGDARFAVSPLVLLEALVVPLLEGDHELIAQYQGWFGQLQMLDLGIPEHLRAAELRARNPGLRTPDALHLAAAQLAGCTALWTNDRRVAAASAGFAVDITDAGLRS